MRDRAATGILAAVVSILIMIQAVVPDRARGAGPPPRTPSVLGPHEPLPAARHLGHQPPGQPPCYGRCCAGRPGTGLAGTWR